MNDSPRIVERIQTGVRLEKSLMKVLRGLAEYLELSLSDLLEGMVLHALEGRSAFADKPELLATIEGLKRIYGMDYGSEAAHRLVEQAGEKAEDEK
jgi:hypothetical protein